MRNQKLKLNCETLRKLDRWELERVQGRAAQDTKTCLTKDCIPTVYHQTCRCEYC